MAKTTEQVGHSELVSGGETTLHSHAGGGLTNLDGGVASSVYGGVGGSPVDGGDASSF